MAKPTMAVTPLATRPNPPNNNLARAMYVWVTATPSQDPLDTDTDQQNLVNFCGTNGINVLFLDIWQYLGGANWTSSKVTRMRQFLDLAHRSGIRVYALCGNTDWGVNHAWVMNAIVEPVIAFNAMGTQQSHQFDGVMLDVEYWTDEANYPAATNLPGLCDLVKAIKSRSDGELSVGCFAGFFLCDGARAPIDYNGKLQQDGYHLMDTCDFVVVGAYRDHAEDNGTDGPGQITLFQPWYDYASQQGKNLGLYCGSETISVTPAYVTYQGASKASMEAQHALISAAFTSTTNSAFIGQAVHSYDGYKVMT